MMILHHQDQGWEVRRSVFNVAAADSTGQKHWDAAPNVTPNMTNMWRRVRGWNTEAMARNYV